MKKTNEIIKKIIFFSIVLFITIYIWANNSPRDGLEYLFLLPLMFGINILIHWNILKYKGVGLKVFYLISIIRYVIQPLLVVITEGKVSYNRMSIVNASSYKMAIFIQIVEITISFMVIHIFYSKLYNKYKLKSLNSDLTTNRMNKVDNFNIFEIIIVLIYVAVLIARINVWLPAIKIFGMKESDITGILMENTLFSVLKTLLFIHVLNFTIKARGKRKIIGVVFCIITTLICVFTYFGNNRALIIEILITCIYMILHHIPKYKKIILTIVVPLSLFVIGYMFISKQFHIDNINEFDNEQFDLQYFSNQLEEYTNGPWCIAQTYEASKDLSFDKSVKAVTKEFTNSLTVISSIPSFRWILNATISYESATDIFRNAFQTRNRGQIPSFSGGMFYFYGIIGYIMFPIANIIASYLLVKYSVKYQFANELIYEYTWVWLSILFGLTYCYCARVLLYCIAKYILFLIAIAYFKKLNYINYKKIKLND